MRTVKEYNYPAIVAQLREKIHLLPSLHTFVVAKTMRGGISPELLDTMALVPTLRALRLDAPWFSPKIDAPFLLSPTETTLRFVSYPFTLTSALSGERQRREPELVAVEATNLRHILEGCRATLEVVIMPGELLL